MASDQLPTPLPAGWAEHSDPSSGKLYYHNAATGETTWDHPGGAGGAAVPAADGMAAATGMPAAGYGQAATGGGMDAYAAVNSAAAAQTALNAGDYGGFDAGAAVGGYDFGNVGGGQFNGTGGMGTGMAAMASGMKQGTVKVWFEEKGFGFIAQNDSGEDVFVHRNTLEDGQMLMQGATVSYVAEWNPRSNKYAVTRCIGAVPGSGGKGGGKGACGGGFGGFGGFDGFGGGPQAGYGGGKGGGMSGSFGGGGGAPGSQMGTVKVWFEEKGFGFITPSNGGEDIFVHRSALSDGQSLAQGATVSYTASWNAQKNKMAINSCSGAVPGAGGGGKGGNFSKGCGGCGQFGGNFYSPY